MCSTITLLLSSQTSMNTRSQKSVDTCSQPCYACTWQAGRTVDIIKCGARSGLPQLLIGEPHCDSSSFSLASLSTTLSLRTWEFGCALPSPFLQFTLGAWEVFNSMDYVASAFCPPRTCLSGVSSAVTSGSQYPIWDFVCSGLPEDHRLTDCQWTGWTSSLEDQDIELDLKTQPW